MDYSKKIKDIDPIEETTVIITRDDLNQFIEEPCLDACRYLYDNNIKTYMSSANKSNIGGYGYIDIELNSLSMENKQIILNLLEQEEMKDKLELSTGHGSDHVRIIKIKSPINENTTTGEVRNDFMRIVELFKVQDVLYGRNTYEEIVAEIKDTYGIDENNIDKELIQDFGYFYCEEDNIYFKSQELLTKHLNYMHREKDESIR